MRGRTGVKLETNRCIASYGEKNIRYQMSVKELRLGDQVRIVRRDLLLRKRPASPPEKE